MSNIVEIYNTLDQVAPFSNAEDWDNSGLLVGSMYSTVTKIAVALDATLPVIEEASKDGAELIVTHHPIIFNAIKQLDFEEPSFFAAYHGISVISAHTNFDIHILPELMLQRLGLTAKIDETANSEGILLSESGAGVLKPENMVISIDGSDQNAIGYGRIVDLPVPMTANALAGRIKQGFDIPYIRGVAYKKEFKRVAVLSGSASEEFINYAVNRGVDVLIAGEFKHSAYMKTVSLAETNLSLFEIGHFYSENIFTGYVMELLTKKFPEIKVFEPKQNINPYKYV